MQMTPHIVRAADLVKLFEPFEPHAVRRPDGGWAIGYGHIRTAREGATVSRSDGEALLVYDLIAASAAVERAVRLALTDNQRAALTAFAFNIGEDAFTRSGAVERLNAGDLSGALREMERWRRADPGGGSQVAEGLVQRRAAERLLFLTPHGFEQSSTPLTPPGFDLEPEPLERPVAIVPDAGEAAPPPVLDIAADALQPPPGAEGPEPPTSCRDGATPTFALGASGTDAGSTPGRTRAAAPVRLARSGRRVAVAGCGALGLVLFALSAAMILSGRLGGGDLALGLVGVLLMTPATFVLLGRRRAG